MSRSPAGTSSRATAHAHYDESLRQGILTEAARRLQDAAPETLGLRPLAASQGTSTTAIYTMFGGKAGLLTAVATEADRQLAESLRAVLKQESVETDMRALCRAYRLWALGHQGLYGLVVGEMSSGDSPTRRPQVEGEEPLWRQPLLEIVDALMDEGIFRNGDVYEITASIWASLHGIVSLEISVWPNSPSAEQYFETQLAAILRSWAASESAVERSSRATTASAV